MSRSDMYTDKIRQHIVGDTIIITITITKTKCSVAGWRNLQFIFNSCTIILRIYAYTYKYTSV
jgi:hypothetical protein